MYKEDSVEMERKKITREKVPKFPQKFHRYESMMYVSFTGDGLIHTDYKYIG